MGYRNLTDCVNDLEQAKKLIRVSDAVDANLEAAEIHRRVYQAGGPAILFDNVKGCEFPMVSNLFGTLERAKYIFQNRISNNGALAVSDFKTSPSTCAEQRIFILEIFKFRVFFRQRLLIVQPEHLAAKKISNIG